MFSNLRYVLASLQILTKGAIPVPVPINHKFFPLTNESVINVPTGLFPTCISSPTLILTSLEVKGPSSTTIDKNSK